MLALNNDLQHKLTVNPKLAGSTLVLLTSAGLG